MALERVAQNPLEIIGIVLLVALILSLIFKRLGQNPVLGYILCGFLLGPLTGFVQPGNELIHSFSEMGLFVLLFYLGIELSFSDFLKSGMSTLGLALPDMITSATAGTLICLLFGFSPLFSATVGVMLFCTSSAIVGKYMIDNAMMKDRAAQLALAILILQDFLAILILVFLTSFSSSAGSPLDIALTALVFAAACFYVVHRTSHRIEQWFHQLKASDVELTLYGIGIGLLVAVLGGFLQLSAAIGAYFAGFALSELHAGHRIKEQIGFIRDFFLLFFFVAFGSTLFYDASAGHVVFPPMNELVFIGTLVLLLVAVVVIVRSALFTVIGPLFGLSNRSNSQIAILLMPLGEFVIIIAISVLPALSNSEAAMLSPIAFLLIMVTLVIFQPLNKKLDLHDRLTAFIPALAPRPVIEQPAIEHTPESIKHLQDLAFNALIALCLAVIAGKLYDAIPDLGTGIPHARAIVTGLLLFGFAFVPLRRATRALRKFLQLATRPLKPSSG